jgi:hypothetical protein
MCLSPPASAESGPVRLLCSGKEQLFNRTWSEPAERELKDLDLTVLEDRNMVLWSKNSHPIATKNNGRLQTFLNTNGQVTVIIIDRLTGKTTIDVSEDDELYASSFNLVCKPLF